MTDLDILRPLGAGSVSRVLLAREPALKRLVAVKILHASHDRTDVTRLRFEREAQAAASLTHPNITAIYRVGHSADGVPFIVMEYIEGRTLEDMLQASGPFSVRETRRIISSVASALAAAHGKGIVHRDVRPANVMWETGSDRIVLMDFGLAGLLETGVPDNVKLTRIGEQLGDIAHMSPEQLNAEPVTQQSDVYCLGILAIELLTGSVAAMHAAPLSGMPADVDPQLGDIVRRCLAHNPQHRPSAAEVRDSLTRAHAITANENVSLNPFQDFLGQLKRRKVGRVAIAYCFAAGIVLRGAEMVTPGLALHDPVKWYRIAAAITLAGFPVALIVSWLYDWTAGGVRRARTGPLSGSRVLLPLSGLLLSAAVAFGVWLLLMH